MISTITHISRLLILLLIAGPLLRTAHFVLDDHSDFHEVGKFKIEQQNIRHWCEHFIHAEYKGLLPGYDRPDLFRKVSEKEKKLFDVRISQVVTTKFSFDIRGPPVNTKY